MRYDNEMSEAARAVNCGEGRPSTQRWQQQYSSGYRLSRASPGLALTLTELMQDRCMLHASIHRALGEAHYDVLVLRHSSTEPDRIAALRRLVPVVGTGAGPLSRALSIGAWARGYHSPVANYDQQDAAERTLRDWRLKIKRELDRLYSDALAHVAIVLREAGRIVGGD